MAILSKIIESNDKDHGIPDNYISDLSTCFFCESKIKRGGCWAGTHHIGVCESCSPELIDLLIDVLEDTMDFGKLSDDEKIRYINNICENRFLRKKLKKK